MIEIKSIYYSGNWWNKHIDVDIVVWINETFDTLDSWIDQMSLTKSLHMLRWHTRDILGLNDIETIFNGDAISSS